MEDKLKKLGENRHQGPGSRSARQSRRAAERRRRRGRPLPEEEAKWWSAITAARQPNKNFTVAHDGNGGQDYPMVVLVNRYSASAAEIVSRRAAGSRPRLDPRRNHVRQGPGADRVPAERQHRPGADHRALLHAQRTPDPARLLEHLVPRLLLPQQPGPEEHRRREDDRQRPHRVRRRRHHARRKIRRRPS